jgi:hypothetical protein
VVAATDVDFVEVDEDAIEVEGGSPEVDVAAGVFGVVVATDPAEEQALNARVAAMATPATHGRRLASTTPSDQRRGLTATPKPPAPTSTLTHRNLRLLGPFSSDLISSSIEAASFQELTRRQLVSVSPRSHSTKCRVRQLTQSCPRVDAELPES